jgi:L-asparaginase II
VAEAVLVEVSRGRLVESSHRASIAVADPQGRVVFAAGALDALVFPRSAAKPLQALPLIANGVADRLGITSEEIAVACGSHGGEPLHVGVVERMLAKAGATVADLECGAHWPLDEPAARGLAARCETPSAVHNNCSGKHAGFLCLARDGGVPSEGYVHPDHPVMRRVTATLAAVTGATLDASCMGIDGCSIPCFAMPLRSLATAFARLGTGVELSDEHAAAAARIRAAVVAHPDMIAGPGKFDTEIARICGPAALCKCGAEGVAAIALPAAGLGIAVKVADGAGRAAQAAAAAMIGRFLAGPAEAVAAVREMADRPLANWKGAVVGRVQALPPDLP